MRRSRTIIALCAAAAALVPPNAGSSASPRGFDPGPRIAYVLDGDVWTVLTDGADDQQVTSGGAKDSDPSWHPDGVTLAFTRKTANGPQVWVVDTTGGSPVRLLKRASDPSWALDGSAIAFVRKKKGNVDVWAADPDGSNRRRLTSSPAADIEPAWGPKKIAFVSRRGGRHSIWIMTPAGRKERRLTAGTGKDRSPAWVVGEGPGLDVLYEHIEPDGDHDLQSVRVSDKVIFPILVQSIDDDVTPSSAALTWFAFVRKASTSRIITADVDAPKTTARIIVSGSGLKDPAVAPASP
jgi:dipeptidyl aminopeptidase/acylaminoacyl peptidase